MAALLGCLLALLLGLGRDAIPAAFTQDAAVLALVASTLPFVVATQPVNALAFVWDGVLFGAGGFRCEMAAINNLTSLQPVAGRSINMARTRGVSSLISCAVVYFMLTTTYLLGCPLVYLRYASVQMALCAVPAVVIMNLGPHALEGAAATVKLQYVWLGLSLVMCFRALSIWAPYKLQLPPFKALQGAAAAGRAKQQ
jgi:hypothetical protein